MKTSSCKAKGRRFQQWVCEQISKLTGIPWGKDMDIDCRPMGQSGSDVILRGYANEVFNYQIECKNTERLNIRKAFEQAKSHGDKEPLLFHKCNHEEPLVTMRAKELFRILK